MDVIEYFKGMRKRLCEDHLKLLPKKSVGYQTTLMEMSFYDAAIKALEQQPCEDAVSRQAVDKLIDELARAISDERCYISRGRSTATIMQDILDLPSVQPEIVRCKDCKFYSPMNRETKTGICNLTMHQNFGDNWFCAGAERR